jgi:hypothetical protein
LKILFTTHYIDKNGWYDYFKTNSTQPYRISYPLKISYGLRFLKQNIPSIEILEFPTWQQYAAKLAEGFDVVGFSFHTSSTNRVLKMIDFAREKGVPQIWGGNYGAANPFIADRFDKVWKGYCEFEIAEHLGRKIETLIHPPLVDQWWIKPLPFRVQRVAQLQTQRGCPMQCTFCQTPSFAPKPTKVPIESIDRVLAWYKKNGVDWVAILDENFGTFAEHTEQVVELLRKHRLFWSVQTRYENALKHLDHWSRSYLMGVGIGIECVDPEVLKSWKKKLVPGSILHLKEELYKRDRYIWGYYMIGNEKATYESTIEEIETVYNYGFGFVQTTALTPYPDTALWDEIDKKYGIFEKDWDKFDTKHLTWNHPNMAPWQVEKLLDYAFLRMNDWKRFSGFIRSIYKSYSKHLGSYARGLALINSFPVKSYLNPVFPPFFPSQDE